MRAIGDGTDGNDEQSEGKERYASGGRDLTSVDHTEGHMEHHMVREREDKWVCLPEGMKKV